MTVNSRRGLDPGACVLALVLLNSRVVMKQHPVRTERDSHG